MCLIVTVQAAIVARKQELVVEQQQLQAALDAGAASGIDPLDSDIQPDIKARQQLLGLHGLRRAESVACAAPGCTQHVALAAC
jgi:hypothetical protein